MKWLKAWRMSSVQFGMTNYKYSGIVCNRKPEIWKWWLVPNQTCTQLKITKGNYASNTSTDPTPLKHSVSNYSRLWELGDKLFTATEKYKALGDKGGGLSYCVCQGHHNWLRSHCLLLSERGEMEINIIKLLVDRLCI